MRTQLENDGVGPSRMNIWNHPGGEMWLFGGAVTVHAVALEHENSGKSVRAPMALPCVEEVAVKSEVCICQFNSRRRGGEGRV